MIKPFALALGLLAGGCTVVQVVAYTPGRYLTIRHAETDALISQWDLVLESPCGQLLEHLTRLRQTGVKLACSNEPMGRFLPVTAVAKFVELPRASDLDFSSIAFCERFLRLPNAGMTVIEGCREK